jgi:hypothetical protein
VVIFLVAPAIVRAGDGSDGPGATSDRLTGADLTPNCIVRDENGQVTSPLIERIFSLSAKSTVV